MNLGKIRRQILPRNKIFGRGFVAATAVAIVVGLALLPASLAAQEAESRDNDSRNNFATDNNPEIPPQTRSPATNPAPIANLSGKISGAGTTGAVVPAVELPPAQDIFRPQDDLGLASLALRSGQSGLALDFVNGILADAKASPATRDAALLLGASAEIARGRFPEAQKKLDAVKVDSAAKSLRLALVKIGLRDFAGADAILNSISENRLSDPDTAWFFLARGLVEAKKFGDARVEDPENFVPDDSEIGDSAEAFFRRARERAENAAQVAQFDFVRIFAVAVLGGNVSDEKIAELRERASGSGQDSARWSKLLAVSLSARGDLAGAQEALASAKNVSPQERAEFDLLTGFFQSNTASSAARRAFMRVIKQRPARELQEVALAGLWEGIEEMSASQENFEQMVLAANEIEFFFDELDADMQRRSQISGENVETGAADLELLTRARIAALVGNNAVAEKHSSAILEKFPKSNLVPEALRIAVWAAIKKGEYRKAAPLLSRLRDNESDPAEKARLSVKLGECYFESGDYRLAASVYAKTDGSVFGGNYSGYLIFQEIFSEICAGNLDYAAKLLDAKIAEIERDPGVVGNDEIRDWLMRAECTLILALRRTSPARFEEAAARCEELLSMKNVLAPFRVYALWQRAVLASESGNSEVLLENADELIYELGNFTEKDLAETGWDKEKLLSNAALLKARGFFLAGDDVSERAQLELLRAQYPDSTAAIVSYLEEGRALADGKQPTAALRCYEKLIERCGDDPEFSEYTTRAYFEAAQQAAALGRSRDAVAFLDSLASKFPDSSLAFYARLQQADFFRGLNEFDSALAVYEKLKTQYPNRQDLRRVEISRADCLLALAATARGGNDEGGTQDARSDLESAIVAYERLFSLPDVPFDMMAEAGNKWGYATVQTAKMFEKSAPETRDRYLAEAKKIHWRVVNEVFAKASKDGEDPASVWGARTGYWIARSLFAIAEICEQQGDFDGARKAYERVLEWNEKNWIPGAEYARSREAAIRGK
ncbi:MAG: tetratricopeptide repeat protein [Opitutae bacterium]|nr:tetratricopeptide repeat protein [Opitutae bacterium]